MVEIYVDTNIYADYWEDRQDKMRPLGEFAFQLFKRAIGCEFIVYYSEVVLKELCKVYGLPEKECFNIFFRDLAIAGKLKFIEVNKELIVKAKELTKSKKIPLGDAIHALFAQKHGLVLVSRDKHFEYLRYLVDVAKPEEL